MIDTKSPFATLATVKGKEKDPVLHKEELIFENVELTQRSYK